MGCNPFLIDDNRIFEQIKKERIISEDIKNMLATPRNLIDENSTLLGSSVSKEMLYTAIYFVWYFYTKVEVIIQIYKVERGRNVSLNFCL